MTRKDLDQWAQRFSTNLGTGVGRTPFDRIVRHHYLEIQRLLDAHLTFATLAAALGRAGAVRSDGRPYSPDQLYMAVRRAASSLESRSERLSAPRKKSSSRNAQSRTPKASLALNDETLRIKDEGSETASVIDASASVPKTCTRRSGATCDDPETHRDLTDEDVSAALRRIRKSD